MILKLLTTHSNSSPHSIALLMFFHVIDKLTTSIKVDQMKASIGLYMGYQHNSEGWQNTLKDNSKYFRKNHGIGHRKSMTGLRSKNNFFPCFLSDVDLLLGKLIMQG